jgi:hypothetical protein
VIQICDLTAFSEVPEKRLMRRCCLIRLKNSSTCQRPLGKGAPRQEIHLLREQRLACIHDHLPGIIDSHDKSGSFSMSSSDHTSQYNDQIFRAE